MKRTDLTFFALRVPVDFLMLLAAGFTAYILRFQTLQDFRPVFYDISLISYSPYVLLGSMLFIVVFGISGLYTIDFRRFGKELSMIITACSTSIMAVIIFVFFNRELLASRFIVLAVWLLSMLYVAMGRFLLNALRTSVLSAGIGGHFMAVIGKGKNTDRLINTVNNEPSMGYQLAGVFAVYDSNTESSLNTLLEKNRLDEVILMDADISREAFQSLLDYADLHHITLRYSADIIGDKNLEITTLAGIPIVEIKKTKLDGWGRIIKRIFDLVIAAILLLLATPLMILIALAIRLESSGTVIYKNQRVGQRGLFNTYKFRSMYMKYCTGPGYDTTGTANTVEDALIKEKSERTGPVFKILNDPRRTYVGRFIERTSLDELPQLFNVLLGNMSLTGPRPHMPKEVAGYKTHHHQLFSVKPGITGLAQISGRSDLDFDDEAKLDIYYIENWSPWLDLIILLKTPWAVLSRKSRV